MPNMTRMPHAPPENTIQLSLRLDFAPNTRIGPGQIALLAQIDAHGSLRAAAAQLGMSYPKALKLVKRLNSMLQDGAVALAHGGNGGGGATLTPAGKALIAHYRSLEAHTYRDNTQQLDAIARLLKK